MQRQVTARRKWARRVGVGLLLAGALIAVGLSGREQLRSYRQFRAWAFGDPSALTLDQYQQLVNDGSLVGLSLKEAEKLLRYPPMRSAKSPDIVFNLDHLGGVGWVFVVVTLRGARIDTARLVID